MRSLRLVAAVAIAAGIVFAVASSASAGAFEGIRSYEVEMTIERTGVLEVRETIVQLRGLLDETGKSLKKVGAILADAQTIAGNAKGATQDLGALRTDVETNLRKIEQMVNELNRKWPFAREVEIKLP